MHITACAIVTLAVAILWTANLKSPVDALHSVDALKSEVADILKLEFSKQAATCAEQLEIKLEAMIERVIQDKFIQFHPPQVGGLLQWLQEAAGCGGGLK